jgi:glutathione S-transferase
MITLYELHWSHYCEKIRLALDYMQLPWQIVGIHAFSKKEMRMHPLPAQLPNYTVPAILDERTQTFVMDSTPILRYLEQSYLNAPKLFPGDAANRAAIDAQLLEFDTALSIPARRFGYSQMIFECPDVLADLFFTHPGGAFFRAPVVRHITGRVMGMVLSKRFDFHRAESTGLYEALEQYLLQLATKLEGQAFVVGDVFSVADLAFAAQMRPLTIVPFFAEHPQLQSLFVRHRSLLKQYSREGDSLYQTAIASARLRHAPVRRNLRQRVAVLPFAVKAQHADNDQVAVWDAGMWAMPYHYFVTLRQGKLRQRTASTTVR